MSYKEEVRDALRDIWYHLPKVREAHWFRDEPIVQVMGKNIAVGDVYRRKTDGLVVLVSLDTPLKDDVQWLHVSTSFRDRTPSWADMCDVKVNFIGADKHAIQIHPPQSDYVNNHPFTLHL